MKRFFYNIFIFFALILFFNEILFLFAISKYYKKYEKYPDKSFTKFILADSHGTPIHDFSEKYNVFNFSNGCDSYFDMKRKLLFLLRNGYHVDTIYITVDDLTLNPHKEKFNNLDRSSIYSFPDDYESDYKFFKERYIKYYLPILNPKITLLFKFYLKTKLKVIHNNSSNEKAWSDLSENVRINRAKNRMKSQFPTDNRSKRLQNTLLEIISICQTNDIELIGIKFPISNSYIKVLGNINYGADELFISKGLKVIDKKEMFVDNPEYFADQDHMNSKGGKIFTKRILAK